MNFPSLSSVPIAALDDDLAEGRSFYRRGR
jgi:hypothetical protein